MALLLALTTTTPCLAEEKHFLISDLDDTLNANNASDLIVQWRLEDDKTLRERMDEVDAEWHAASLENQDAVCALFNNPDIASADLPIFVLTGAVLMRPGRDMYIADTIGVETDKILHVKDIEAELVLGPDYEQREFAPLDGYKIPKGTPRGGWLGPSNEKTCVVERDIYFVTSVRKDNPVSIKYNMLLRLSEIGVRLAKRGDRGDELSKVYIHTMGDRVGDLVTHTTDKSDICFGGFYRQLSTIGYPPDKRPVSEANWLVWKHRKELALRAVRMRKVTTETFLVPDIVEEPPRKRSTPDPSKKEGTSWGRWRSKEMSLNIHVASTTIVKVPIHDQKRRIAKDLKWVPAAMTGKFKPTDDKPGPTLVTAADEDDNR